MVEISAASHIALKLENKILQAQVKWLMEENVAPQAQIPELQMPQAAKEAEPLQKPSESQETQKPLENLDLPEARECQEFPEVGVPHNLRDLQELPGWKPPAAQENQETPMVQDTRSPWNP